MWWNDYVGIPFLAKGRDRDGIDCWGLVRLVYKEQFNIELPSFSEEYEADDTARMKELVAQYLEGWQETKEPKPGTGILFRVMGFESHMGIYLGDNKFLHCRENQSAVIESLDRIEWKNRLVGFFNYTEKSFAALTVVPHPLKTERWNIPVPPGTTIGEISTIVMEQFKVPVELDQHITIMLNGRIVPKEEYNIVVKDTDVIEYRSVPGKSVLRIALIIAVIIVAANFGPQLGAYLGPGLGAGAQAAVGAAIISTVGNLLIGALMPIRPPSMGSSSDPGSAQNQLLITGGSNQLNKYGSIPVVLGFVRMTPPLGAQNYVQSNTDTSYLNQMLVWGFGPLKVSDLYIGSTSIANYTDVNYTTLGDQLEGDSAADINFYNAYFSSDREQIYKGLTLKTNTGVTAVFSDTTTTRIEVTLHFPQGLRRIVVKGSNAGKSFDQTVTYNITYKIQGGADQNHLTVPVPAKNVILDGVFAGKYAYNWTTEAAGNNTGTPYYRWYRIGIGDWGQYVVKSGTYTNTPVKQNFPVALAGFFGTSTGNSYGYNTTTDRVPFPAWSPTDIPLYDVLVYGSSIVSIDTSCRIPGFSYSGLGISSTSNVTTPTYDNNATVTGGTINTGDIKIVIASGSVTRTSTIAQSINRNSKDSFSHTIGMYVQTGQYTVTVTRTSDDNTEPNENDRPQFIMLFDSATSVSTNTRPIVAPPNCTLTRSAVRIKATNQLNSNIEGINGYVQTYADTYSGGVWGLGITNNPASLFLYVLKHPANAYRITNQAEQINMSAIADWYVFCQQRGYTFNAVVSSTRSVLDVLRDICAAGQASPALVDGKWTVTIDRAQATVVQHFTPNNSWGFEATKYLVKQPHGLRVIFNNEDKGFQEEETIVYNTGYAKVASVGVQAATILEQIQLPGITDALLVQQHARFHMAQAKLRPEVYTLNTDFEYLVCNRGDRVKVTHDVPMWGLASGRIKNRLPQLVTTFGKISVTATSITTTATSTAAGVATINYTAQTRPPFEVGSVITISGVTGASVAAIAHYNISWVVASSTTTQTTFVDGRWGTGNTPVTVNNVDIIVSSIDDRVGVVPLTITTLATTSAPGTATATFATQIQYPFAIGSSITITGAVPAHYNGTWTVNNCVTDAVTFTDTAWGAGNTPGPATTKGTITTLTPRLFELDEEVPLSLNVTYNFRVRAYNGASNLFTTTPVPEKGLYSIIGLASGGATAAQININDLFMFGSTTAESVDLLVMGVEPFGYQNAKLSLVAYDENLYDYEEYLAVNWSLPDWSSQVTAAPKNLVQTITIAPTITSVLSDESVMDVVSPGVFQINIRVGFTNPANLPTLVSKVEAQMDRLGDGEVDWQYAVSVPATMRAINFTNAEEGSYYKIRLRYVSSDGRVGPWATTLFSDIATVATSPDVLTITTAENHSFSVGSKVEIYNSTNTLYNGFYTVRTAPRSAGATGTLTRNTFTTAPYSLNSTSITSTSTATVAGTATATFATEGYIPFVVGSQITITGATAANYNATAKTVIAASYNSVSWADTTWAAAPATGQGIIAQSIQTVALTSTSTVSVAGVVRATISPQSYISLNPGNTITVSGATPNNYNGTKVIVAVDTNFITWSDAAWTATAGTVQATIRRNAIDPGAWQPNATTKYLRSSYGINHLVIGKTSPPSTPTNFAAQVEYSTGRVVLTWNASPEIDVQNYEVRTDTNFGVTSSGLVFFGNALYAISTPAASGVAKNFYVKAVDYSKNYSTTAAQTTFTMATAANVTAITSAVNYLQGAGGGATLTFNWVKGASAANTVDTAKYILSFNRPGFSPDYSQVVTDLNWTTLIDWEGTATLTVKAVDVLGNTASGVAATYTKVNPGLVTATSFGVAGTALVLKWSPPLTGSLPISGYEIRTANTGWGDTTYLWQGSATSFSHDIRGTLSGATPTYYIKAFDTNKKYSDNSLTMVYTVAPPTYGALSNDITFSFTANSLTSSSITLNWPSPAVQPIFGLYGYEVSTDTYSTIVNTTSLTIPTDRVWTPTRTGTKTFSIKVIDNLNIANKSTASTKNIEKRAPAAVPGFYAKVIDNNVLFYWTNPAVDSNSLPIDHVVIKKGVDWASGEVVGEKSGTFTTLYEQTGGTFTYWIAAYDTDGQEGNTASNAVVTVGSPPDYIFNAEYVSNLTTSTGVKGVNTNSYLDIPTGSVYLPVDTTATFGTHFTAAGTTRWAGPQSQINSNFPYFLQPGTDSGYYEEVFDYTKTLGSSQITIKASGTSLSTGNETKPSIITSVYTARPTNATGINTVATSTTVTGTGTNFGNVVGQQVGDFITVPNSPSGQTVRIVSVANTATMTVSTAMATSYSAAAFGYVTGWTAFTGVSTALATNFRYVRVRVTANQSNKNTVSAAGTVSNAAGGSAVTGSGTTFTTTFKVGDKIIIPATGAIDYTISSIVSTTSMSVTPTIAGANTTATYAYRGTDIFKLTGISATLDAKQKTDSSSITALGSDTDGTVVNFSIPFIDVTAITLSSSGTTPIVTVYNFNDSNPAGTYTMSASTVCNCTVTAHGLIATQNVILNPSSGTAPGGTYPILSSPAPTANTFSVAIGTTPITTSGNLTIYPNSMTVYAFNTAGGRVATAPMSWVVRGF